MLSVEILSPFRVVYEGQAHSIILPGEDGVFEVLPFHRPVVSRLLPGLVVVDGQTFPVVHGVAKVETDRVLILVREET